MDADALRVMVTTAIEMEERAQRTLTQLVHDFAQLQGHMQIMTVGTSDSTVLGIANHIQFGLEGLHQADQVIADIDNALREWQNVL